MKMVEKEVPSNRKVKKIKPKLQESPEEKEEKLGNQSL
jgi:hypothetical protein